MTALLEVRGLTTGYGAATVLHEVDLTVEPGQIVAVLGANGAGKTTLLRALSGLLKARGEIIFDGLDLRGVRVEQMVRRGIAHVPEGRGVITELTVEENLRLGTLWRRKRTSLDAVYDLFAAYAFNKAVSLTIAYVDLGSIATFEHQRGVYASLQAGF